MDLAIDVLPTPGGPLKRRIGPRAMARALASLVSVICRLSSSITSDGASVVDIRVQDILYTADHPNNVSLSATTPEVTFEFDLNLRYPRTEVEIRNRIAHEQRVCHQPPDGRGDRLLLNCL